MAIGYTYSPDWAITAKIVLVLTLGAEPPDRARETFDVTAHGVLAR